MRYDEIKKQCIDNIVNSEYILRKSRAFGEKDETIPGNPNEYLTNGFRNKKAQTTSVHFNDWTQMKDKKSFRRYTWYPQKEDDMSIEMLGFDDEIYVVYVSGEETRRTGKYTSYHFYNNHFEMVTDSFVLQVINGDSGEAEYKMKERVFESGRNRWTEIEYSVDPETLIASPRSMLIEVNYKELPLLAGEYSPTGDERYYIRVDNGQREVGSPKMQFFRKLIQEEGEYKIFGQNEHMSLGYIETVFERIRNVNVLNLMQFYTVPRALLMRDEYWQLLEREGVDWLNQVRSLEVREGIRDEGWLEFSHILENEDIRTNRLYEVEEREPFLPRDYQK